MFTGGKILIPNADLGRWSVVACDQFTSDPAYWEKVAVTAGDSPSALRVIFPEAHLAKVDFDSTIAAINRTMNSYLTQGIFDEHDGMVYCRRTLATGAVRHGIVGLLDLECYDFAKGAMPPVRATEGTVLERIPPRVRIRENAAIELPHVMLLADDPARSIIEPIADDTDNMQRLYDFELMQGGGHVTGWLLGSEQIAQVQAAIIAITPEGDNPLVLAVGDGNHSLATARECYKQHPNLLNRYAMVELCNLHDDSLVFEAIHRTVFGVDPHLFFAELTSYCNSLVGSSKPQSFTVVSPHGDYKVVIPHPEQNLAVGSVQKFLDNYTKLHGGEVDYIHGETEARSLVSDSAVSILLPSMDKSELFPTVVKDGVLPRKTFSMGEARDKRYYLECRRIR